MQPNASNANQPETAKSRERVPLGKHMKSLVTPGIIMVAGVILDRVTKVLAETHLRDAGNGVAVFDGLGEYFMFVLHLNSGAAFGVRFGDAWVHVLLSLAAMILVGILMWQTAVSDKLSRIGLGMIMSGALGNLWDRVAVGAVTDFIKIGIPDVWYWPTFNIADTFVVIGIGLLLIAHIPARTDAQNGKTDHPRTEEPREAETRSDTGGTLS